MELQKSKKEVNTMNMQISPSMMCADILSMRETLTSFAESGIEYLHIDIMDGSFVPNFTLGTDYCAALHRYSNIPLDIHMMVERPEDKLKFFTLQAGDIVSVHAESTYHIQRTLTQIRQAGARPFLALNPATPLSYLDYVLDDIDGVLIMTVNPGFAGQKLIPQTLDKIRRLRTFLAERGYGDLPVECDGNVSFENARKMRAAGADIFVAGTSSIYAKGHTLEENLEILREAIL